MNKQSGLSVIILILIILVLVLAGGSFMVMKQKRSANVPKATTFEYVDLNEEVVVFLFQRVPSLYNRISRLNDELTLISSELDRLDSLEDEYPSGKQFIENERSLWLRLQKDLNMYVASSHDAAESYYVSYMVNPEKGASLISENLGDLNSGIDTILQESVTETGRLRTDSEQTLLEKLKNLF